MLCSLEQFRRDDLQVRQHLGAAVTAAKYASIGEVANDPPDAGVMPHLTRSCTVAELVQIGGDPLGTEALMHILVKDDPHNSGLGLVDNQLVNLVLALVVAPASYKVIAIGSKAAFEAAVLDELTEGGFCADRSLFAFAASLSTRGSWPWGGKAPLAALVLIARPPVWEKSRRTRHPDPRAMPGAAAIQLWRGSTPLIYQGQKTSKCGGISPNFFQIFFHVL